MTHPALIALTQGTITADEFMQRAPFLDFPVQSPTGKALAARLLGKHEATVGLLMAAEAIGAGQRGRLPAGARLPNVSASMARICDFLRVHGEANTFAIARYLRFGKTAVHADLERLVLAGMVRRNRDGRKNLWEVERP